MIAYVTVGADDIARAKRFYSAFLRALDYELKEGSEGLSYALPIQPGQSLVLPDFYVKPTFDKLLQKMNMREKSLKADLVHLINL